MNKQLEDTDIKIGNRIKAKWDGAVSEILSIKNGMVKYKCLIYDSWLNKDGTFNSSIEEIKEHFIKVGNE